MKLSRSRAIDFRVNTLPTLFGEKIVLRILDPSSAQMGIDALGYEEEQKEMYMRALHQPQVGDLLQRNRLLSPHQQTALHFQRLLSQCALHAVEVLLTQHQAQRNLIASFGQADRDAGVDYKSDRR